MITTVTEQIVGEMRSHPFTLLTVLCLVGFSVYAYSTHASATEIGELSRKVAQNTDKIDKVLILQLAESLRNLQRQRCAEDEADHLRTLEATIDELQAEYRRIVGERYPLQRCD